MISHRMMTAGALLSGLALGGANSESAAAQDRDSLPLELFSYDRSAPLEQADSQLRERDGVRVHRLSYASPKGGRVTGRLAVPNGSGPFAGVVVMHGMPGNSEGVMGIGLTIARAGAVVVAIDAPWARRPGGQPLSLTPADSVDQVQLIIDLQRAVDLLLARSDVDPERLGYVGRSYGGAMGALFAGVERRLKTYALQVGDGGVVSHFTGAEDPPNGPFGVTREGWQRWLRAMEPIEPIRFISRAAPASLYFQSGRQDRLVPPADAERLQQAGSEPRKTSWYDTGHGLDSAAERDLLAWLHQAIGLNPPS